MKKHGTRRQDVSLGGENVEFIKFDGVGMLDFISLRIPPSSKKTGFSKAQIVT